MQQQKLTAIKDEMKRDLESYAHIVNGISRGIQHWTGEYTRGINRMESIMAQCDVLARLYPRRGFVGIRNQAVQIKATLERGLRDSKRYNGYANYETWAVALWIDNDGQLYNYWRGQAKTPGIDKYELACRLQDRIEDNSPLASTANLYADLLNAELSQVIWIEVAENILSE